MNVNLLNACICLSLERLSALPIFRGSERPKGLLAIGLGFLEQTATPLLYKELKAKKLTAPHGQTPPDPF